MRSLYSLEIRSGSQSTHRTVLYFTCLIFVTLGRDFGPGLRPSQARRGRKWKCVKEGGGSGDQLAACPFIGLGFAPVPLSWRTWGHRLSCWRRSWRVRAPSVPEIFFPQISKPMQFLHKFSFVIFCANIIVIWSKMPAKIMSIKKGDYGGGSGVILLIGKIAGRLLASLPLV